METALQTHPGLALNVSKKTKHSQWTELRVVQMVIHFMERVIAQGEIILVS